MIHHDDSYPCIPHDIVLNQFEESRERGVPYFVTHLREFDSLPINPDPMTVMAVTVGSADRSLIGTLLAPWLLSREVHASVLVDSTSPGHLYMTEINLRGRYTTVQVSWRKEHNQYVYDEPSIDIHLPSWEAMENLKGGLNPEAGVVDILPGERGPMPFKLAIGLVLATLGVSE